MSEILKVKVSKSHTLIAYEKSEGIRTPSGKPTGKSRHEVAFKVGPGSRGFFIDCSPEQVSILLAMATAAGTLTAACDEATPAETESETEVVDHGQDS